MTLQPVPSTQLEDAPGANPMQRFDNSEDKRESHSFLSRTRHSGKVPSPIPIPSVLILTFSSTSLRSCSHSRLSGFTRFCVKSRVSLSDSP